MVSSEEVPGIAEEAVSMEQKEVLKFIALDVREDFMCTTEKEKLNAPKGTKVVLRRLPRDMTEVDLIAKLGQTPPSIYTYFVPADKEMEPYAYSRCYFTFVKNSEVLEFSRRWNGYRFVDANGNHSIAVVELTANDRVPRKPRSEVSKDPKCGTIENEVEYKQFMHDLEVEYEMVRLSLDEQLLHAQQLRIDAKASAVQPTPLTHYIIKEMDAKAQRKMVSVRIKAVW
uniref:Smg4_UPF3 domain-containing protein n=1 Tax=Angiostrongylus cantonensis TaxID=6313 RepID=A0A0K0DKY9_ANGCA